jgi:hypothetical protein
VLGAKIHYRAIVGDETQIDTFLGYHSGSSKVAGRAFLSSKGFYVAMDTIRPSLKAIKHMCKRASSKYVSLKNTSTKSYLSEFSNKLLRRALHSVLPKSNLPTPNEWDQFYREILVRELETVHNHELGHVVDFPCFLPIASHAGNILSMLWKERFSPERIQTRFESVAEIFGLAHTPYPDYYLWQVMERLDVGFDGVFDLVYWAWYGRFPQDDPYYLTSERILSHLLAEMGDVASLDRLSQKQFQELLEKICKRAGVAKVCRTP